MKRLIKLIVLFLAVILFAGCVPTRVESNNFYDSDELDFYGLQFIIMQFTSVTLSEGNPMLYVNDTPMTDISRARIEEIESEYNCDISIHYRKRTGNYMEYLMSQTAVSQPVADIFLIGDPSVTYNLMKDGFLYALSEVSDIIEYDSSTFDIYGPPSVLESAMYDGELYMVTPYAHPGRQYNSGEFFVFNTEVVNSLAGVDLRALNEQGQWTWSSFENIIKLCTLWENGIVSVQGASVVKSDFVEYAFASNGFVREERSVGGYYFDSSKAINAIDWAKKIAKQYHYYITFESTSKGLTGFVDGRNALLLVTAEYLKNKVAYQAKGEFGVVPFPCGPEGNPKTNINSSYIEGLGIYYHSEAPEQAAYIINAYCQPFDEYPTTESVMAYYENLLWDSRDIEVLINAEKNSQFNYSPAGGVSFFKSVGNNFAGMSAIQILQTYGDSLNNVIKDLLIPNSELIEELEG